MLLELEDIEVYYGVAKVIKGVSIQVSEGSLVTLLGSNGAGKTTILRAISGLKDIVSGKVIFAGNRIENMFVEEVVRKGIAHVPQGRRVFPSLTTLENLRMGAYLQKKGETERLLGQIWGYFPILRERMNQLAGSLSGGEQQMLAIARALMASPKLLLMDEPSMGLSPLMVSNIGKIIEIIRERGMTIFLAEQNATFALKLAQLGYVLQAGEVIFRGSASDLLGSDYVRKAYLGA